MPVFEACRGVCQRVFARAFVCAFGFRSYGARGLILCRDSIRGVTLACGVDCGQVSKFIVGVRQYSSLLCFSFARCGGHITRYWDFLLIVHRVGGDSTRYLVRLFWFRLRVFARLRIRDDRELVRRRRLQLVSGDANCNCALLLPTQRKVRVPVLVIHRPCRAGDDLCFLLSDLLESLFRFRSRNGVVRRVRVERRDVLLRRDVCQALVQEYLHSLFSDCLCLTFQDDLGANGRAWGDYLSTAKKPRRDCGLAFFCVWVGIVRSRFVAGGLKGAFCLGCVVELLRARFMVRLRGCNVFRR